MAENRDLDSRVDGPSSDTIDDVANGEHIPNAVPVQANSANVMDPEVHDLSYAPRIEGPIIKKIKGAMRYLRQGRVKRWLKRRKWEALFYVPIYICASAHIVDKLGDSLGYPHPSNRRSALTYKVSHYLPLTGFFGHRSPSDPRVTDRFRNDRGIEFNTYWDGKAKINRVNRQYHSDGSVVTEFYHR